MTSESYNYTTEADPFERNTIRLRGLRAIAMVTECSMRDPAGKPADHVISEVFHAIELMSEDIERDMYEVVREALEDASRARSGAERSSS